MCIRLGVYQTKNGVRAFTDRSMKRPAWARNSSSTVGIRLEVSAPVSRHFCLPTLPKRGSTVGSSSVDATQSKTPLGR